LAVYRATREAVERARQGDGPTLIECKTMRMLGHAAHDDAGYVPRELLAEWERKDPLHRYTKVLEDRGLLTPEIEEQVEARVRADVKDAQAFATQSPLPDAGDLEKGVYHEPECYWDRKTGSKADHG
jgi:TPP-dependent pyruvate/acetoin dehydrogenase alpha subunit